MTDVLTLRRAAASDAAQVAGIFLTSRQTAMPWLAQPHTDAETWSTSPSPATGGRKRRMSRRPLGDQGLVRCRPADAMA